MDEASIFLEALQQPSPGERAAFLDRACGANEQLRHSVELLIKAHERAGQFLAPPPTSAPVHELPVESPGVVMGPYKLIELIGEGGMGAVWMAQQTAPVKRLVALKLIKPGMDSRQIVARFEVERQALALMDHPNIAKVLDGGSTSTGRPYFVMDLVKGLPITRYCDEHHLTPRERLELFVPVCQAVQHAHQKGIIHRDLKPSNILIALFDGHPVPKIIDFGVAKATGHSLTDKTLVTGFGNIVGTLEYMSPEQAEFNQLDIDTRSDVYSLGVLLYELLTGSPPFSRTELEKAGMLEMLRVIREQEPSKPSTKLSTAEGLPTLAANRGTEPAKLTKLVRGELDWIVMKALEKDRNRRYETANGFAMDVQRYLSDEAVLACPPSVRYRLKKFIQRNKTGAAVAALVLFFLVILGTSVGWALRDRAATAQKIAAQRVEQRLRREQKLDQLLAEIELDYQSGQHAKAVAAIQQAEGILADGLASADLIQRVARWRADLSMVSRLERIRLERATLSDDAKWDWSGSDRAYQQAFREYGLEIELGTLEELSSRFTQVRIAAELAVALDDWASVRRQIPGSDEASWRRLIAAASVADPDTLRNRLRSLWGRKIDEVRGEIEQLVASLPNQKLQPTTVVLVARVLRQAGLNAEAENVLRSGQERYPSDFWINFDLAYHLTEQPWNKRVDAPGFYRAAIAVRPDNALVHSNLGFTFTRLSRKADAERAHREAIRLAPNYAYAHLGLGYLFRDQGQWSDAITAFEDAIRLDPGNTAAHAQLAKILTNCPEPGLRDYPRALEVAEKASKMAPNASWEMQFLGWAEYRVGHWQAAIDALEKSCQLQNNGGVGDAFQWFFLAMANHQLGRKEEARRWYDKSFQLTVFWNDESRRMQAEAADLLGIASPPEQFFTSLSEGHSHYDASRWQEAIDAYSKAIQLAPIQAAGTWMRRGKSYLELKRYELAERDLTKAIEIAPQQEWTWHLRGRAMAGLGKREQAIADFTKALEMNPQDSGALGHRGLARMKLKRLDEAIADLTKAVALEPQRNWLWQGRADAHAAREAWDLALSDYQRAVQCDPSANWMWKFYLDCCAKAGRWDEAVIECDKALSALKTTKNPWHEDSKICDIAAQRDEMYERLRKLRPADRPLRIARLKHLVRQGEGAQASAEIAELINLDPNDHWTWYVASLLYLDAGDVDGYRGACREMLSRFAMSPDPFVAERIAKSCFLSAGAAGDLSAARQLADRATLANSGNQGFRLVQALGAYRAGQFEVAIERLQGCLDPAQAPAFLAETAWLVRSLAEQRLQRTAEARDAFAKAQELSDQQTRREESPLSEMWAEKRHLDFLYQETAEALALGDSRGPSFVVARGNPVVERTFFTLAAAVAGTQDGDVIEVRGNGPFFTRPIVIGNRRLTIRAGGGFRPVLQFGVNGDVNKGALLFSSASLVLEGLELRDGGLADPSPRYPSVVSSHLAPLYIANCRFLVNNQRAISHGGGRICEIRNCEFLGKPHLMIRCDAGQRIVLDNNLLPRAGDIPMFGVWPPAKDVSIELTRNNLHGNAAVQFYLFQTPLGATSSDLAPVDPVRIASAGNIFDIYHFGMQFGFDLADGIHPEEAKAGLRRLVDWKQQEDLFVLRTAPAVKIRANQASGERIDVAKIISLKEWTQFWGLPNGTVIGGKVEYEGGDLPRRAEAAPEQLKPDDFRLRSGSAGYRAGSDGKDLGPELDLVGPGAAYERWKQTSKYQEWLKRTAQTK